MEIFIIIIIIIIIIIKLSFIAHPKKSNLLHKSAYQRKEKRE